MNRHVAALEVALKIAIRIKPDGETKQELEKWTIDNIGTYGVEDLSAALVILEFMEEIFPEEEVEP